MEPVVGEEEKQEFVIKYDIGVPEKHTTHP
jgi:hypothetical protein